MVRVQYSLLKMINIFYHTCLMLPTSPPRVVAPQGVTPPQKILTFPYCYHALRSTPPALLHRHPYNITFAPLPLCLTLYAVALPESQIPATRAACRRHFRSKRRQPGQGHSTAVSHERVSSHPFETVVEVAPDAGKAAR